MANVLEFFDQPQRGDAWNRAPDRRRARLLRRFHRQQQSALKRGEKLLACKTQGEPETILARMQQIAAAYERYHAALVEIVRLELF
jgi:hypothetical protein